MSVLRGHGLALYSAFVAVTCLVAARVNREVPEPYLDEVFHIPQAQAYCRGDWLRWDAKLTTPPGLYLPAAALARALRDPALCSPSLLRVTNLLLVAALPPLFARLLRRIRGTACEPAEAVGVALFPVVYFFAFLYYTDVASLVAVLAAYDAALADRPARAAAIGLLSLSFRQTNVLWVAFIAAASLWRTLDAGDDPLLIDASLAGLFALPSAVLRHMAKEPRRHLTLLAPYAAVGAAFVAFVRWNGGIVLGDRDRHTVILHVPQLYYFIGFAAAFLAPTTLSLGAVVAAVHALIGSPRRALVSLSVAGGMAWTIERYTFEHPFLLADNRHYAFYVWHRLYRRYPLARYALVPAYMLAAVVLFDALRRGRSLRLLPFVAFLGALALSLVPSPLLEPRYFIVPAVLARLHHAPPSRARLWLELAAFAAVDAATLYVFLERSFRWPTEPGPQRFMW